MAGLDPAIQLSSARLMLLALKITIYLFAAIKTLVWGVLAWIGASSFLKYGSAFGGWDVAANIGFPPLMVVLLLGGLMTFHRWHRRGPLAITCVMLLAALWGAVACLGIIAGGV
jgi:hypothetical protein